MTPADEARAAIVQAAETCDEARTRLGEATDGLRAAIRQGYEADLSMVEVSKLARVSRPTAYSALAD